MAQINDNARRIELQMIQEDAEFHFGIISHLRPSRQGGILIPAYLPHICRFIIESVGWFERTLPDVALLIQMDHEPLIRSMRHKTKLFEEHNITAMISEVARFQKVLFIESHTEPFADLKRLIQPDLGLYFYQSYLIGTTYSIYLYMIGDSGIGLTDANAEVKKLGILGHSVGIEIGSYLGSLLSAFRGQSVQLLGVADESFDTLIHWRDVKSDDYLATIFNGPSSRELNTCLIHFASFFNFVHHVMCRLAADNTEAFSRIKYLTLYHLRTSLEQIQNANYQSGLLTEKSQQSLGNILKDKELKALLSKSKFRNAITHYDLMELDIDEADLNPDTSFTDVVARIFPGQSFEEFDALLDRQMNRIAACLEEWLGVGL